MNRIKWLEERRKGIGGSDAAAVCGLSPWKTALEVYFEKIGELADQEENADMRRGTLLEPVVRQMYADETGYEVEKPDGIVTCKKYPFALANLDGRVPAFGGIAEFKTSRDRRGWGDPGSDEIPQVYLLQAQHYLAVTGTDRCDVACLFGDFELGIYTILADPDFAELLMEAESRFWRDHVLARVPPDPMTHNDIKLRWPKSRPITVPGAMKELEAAAVLSAVKDRIKTLEAIQDRCECILKTAIADNEAVEFAGTGDILATWKSAKGSTKFDAKRFQAEHPKLYSKYLTETTGSRRFLLKGNAPCLQSITMNLPQIPENLLQYDQPTEQGLLPSPESAD